MEQLLSSFLLKHKYCPLPTIGSLALQTEAAVSSITDKARMAPRTSIVFTEKEMDADSLLNYIASKTGSTEQTASQVLSSYCSKLQQIQPYEQISFNCFGSFSKDEAGNMQFTNTAALQHYSAPVIAERVIHPDASHEMLVGDKATNTVYMHEMLTTEVSKKFPKWGWFAVILAVAAATIIIIALANNISGNKTAVNAQDAPPTYKTISK